MDGKMGRVPCCDPVLIQVDHIDHDLRVMVCDESGSWTAYREESATEAHFREPLSLHVS